MPRTTSPTATRARETRTPVDLLVPRRRSSLPLMNLLGQATTSSTARSCPGEGAFVLAPNHYTEIDPVVIGVAVWKQRTRCRASWRRRRCSRCPCSDGLLRASGQIPVERAGATRGTSALAAAEELVEQGRAVIVYPEGSLTRDPDMWPMRGKTGAVRIALERDIPLIPVAHWGTQQVMPRYGKKISPVPPRSRST